MERAKQVHAQVDERHERHAADAEHGGVAGARARVHDGPAQQQVAYIKEKEEQGGGETRIPGPPRAPHRLSPDRSGRQHDRGEHGADLGRRLGKPVEAGVLQEEEHHARHADEHHRQLGPHRSRDVQVEDLLRRPLQPLHRREDDGAHVHAAEQHEAHQGGPVALPSEGHCSTVCGNKRVARVTNATSYAASNLSQPATSLKGRAASSLAVTCTAPMSGGMRNGSSSTGNISSAKRVRTSIALNSVPTATNPTVASAMTPTKGPSTSATGTLKNNTNSGRPTASTTATNTRLAASLPQ